MKFVHLDKVLTAGTEYVTPKRIAYIIEKIGTNSSGDAYLEIEGRKTGVINSTVAPLHVTSSNKLGPLDLGKLYYFIPPETKFKFVGDSGSKCRIIGKTLILSPGESVPDEYMTRFEAQSRHYFKYVEGTYSHGTDVAWTANDENEVLSITPLTIEKYIFNRILMASVENVTISEGDMAITVYLDNTPIPFDWAENIQRGIDVLSCPRPPSDSTEEVPFTFEHLPIEVTGDHTISFRAINTSGADLTPASGTSITVTITAIVEYLKQA